MKLLIGHGLLSALVIAGAGVALWSPPAGAQSSSSRPAKTLDGVWNYATITPLERPAHLGDQQTFTDAEVRAFEAEAARQRVDPPEDRKTGDASEFGPGRAYNQFWRDPGSTVVATNRTSIVIDPVNGRLPPLTSEAEARRAARLAATSRLDGPEDLNNASRCLVGFNSGPPMIPGAYNNYLQIVQTRDHVVLFNEMAAPRIVPLDGRPHGRTRQWLGDSRGRWEGETLVVETINFTDKAAFMNVADENLRVTERFTRLDPDTLLYRFTVDNPGVWTRPWTGELSMARTADSIYEYACHEGNYGMANSLKAARAGEHK